MVDQVTDTEPNPLARRDDPESSQQAGRDIVPYLSGLWVWAQECVTESPGLTQRELGTKYCPNDPRKIGRRLVECERHGMVIRGEKRRCTVSGKTAETWWPVETQA